MKELRVNEKIRVAEVRLIDAQGNQAGIVPVADAIAKAKAVTLDLVEVAPLSKPPVCRIMDYNKHRYDEQRKERQTRRKQHVTRLKEVKFKPHIEEHDYTVKMNRLKRFLMRGDQTKVTMTYRGREMAHTEVGRKVLERVIVDLKGICKVDRKPSLEGRMMTMILNPDREGIKKIERDEARRKKEEEKQNAETKNV